MRVAPLWLTILLLDCLGSLSLMGNGGGYVRGLASTGAFKPFGIEQVEMLSERLEIDLHIEYAEVRIEYVLHNPGAKVTVEAGFPVAVPRDLYFGAQPKAWTGAQVALQDFELVADGKPVKIAIVEDDLRLSGPHGNSPFERNQVVKGWRASMVKGWHVFRLDFAKGQTRRVSVKYRNPYSYSYTHVSESVSMSELSLSYLFSSAAAWSGPITQGSVEIRAVSANPDFVKLSHPKRFQREGNSWKWLFADLEPTLEDDLTINAGPGYYRPGSVESDEKGNVWYVEWNGRRANSSSAWELFRQDYQVSASSTKKSEGSFEYGAQSVSDRTRRGAWVEGVKGDGIGESLTLTLPKLSKVRRVGFVTGYASTEEQYAANNRVARLEVRVNNGSPFQVEVPDERLEKQYFWFDLLPATEPVKTVKLTILGVHKGTQFEDTCISEVVLAVPLAKEPKVQPTR